MKTATDMGDWDECAKLAQEATQRPAHGCIGLTLLLMSQRAKGRGEAAERIAELERRIEELESGARRIA